VKYDLYIALISDAGSPAVSDPGFSIVQACLAEGIPVEVVPGVSAVLTALVGSGLPTDKFLFVGYPPHKGGKRIQLYENLKCSHKYIDATVILFEAPHKVSTTLSEMQEVFGDIEIVLARELTKIHEEMKTCRISEAVEMFKKAPPKGEFVLLFHLPK
jgi:16S rRNA (cytidine1402-2'-O)-methyltransferase